MGRVGYYRLQTHLGWGKCESGWVVGLAPGMCVTTGGGGWYDSLVCFGLGMFWSAADGAYWPIAIRCPSLGPFPSIGGAAHQPLTTLCPPSPSLPYLPSLLPLPLPREVVPKEPQDCPCFTALCRHTEEGNCPRRWPNYCLRNLGKS